MFNPYYPQIQRQEIIHVNGKGGADAFQLAPNSSALLLDDTAPIIWLKVTDGAGYPTVTPYTITPYVPEPPVDLKSLEERIKKLEGMLNNESNSAAASEKRKQQPAILVSDV